LDARPVRPPPAGRVLLQLGARIERHGGLAEFGRVEHSLEHQRIGADARRAFKGRQRMARMVEDAGKQYDVEGPYGRWRDVVDVDVLGFELRRESAPDQF